MAIRVMRGLQAEWYTPKSEAGESEPSKFQLQPLTGMQKMEVMCHGVATPDGMFRTDHDGQRLLLRYGVTGWVNVHDEEGNPLEFTRQELEKLPMNILTELANEVLQRAVLQEVDRKKSGSQSKSSETGGASTAPAASGGDTATPATPPR